MRTKMALAVLAASTLAAGNMSAFGGVLKSESTPATSEVQTEEASGAEDEAQTVSIETSEYYFGKINVPYADFIMEKSIMYSQRHLKMQPQVSMMQRIR